MTLLYKTVVLVGYAKAGPFGSKGQIVQAHIGNPQSSGQWTEVKMNEGEGEYLHARTQQPFCWRYVKLMLESGDLLKISTKVGIVGVGPDEDRTMDMVFAIDPSVGVVELSWKGIGYKGYPLAKGRLREISRNSAANMRITTKVNPMLENEFEGIEGEGRK